jgi:hypothetical protein
MAGPLSETKRIWAIAQPIKFWTTTSRRVKGVQGGAGATSRRATLQSVTAPYRVPPPIEPDPYLVAWAKLRRKRFIAWLSFLAWVPVALLSNLTVERVLGHDAGLYVVLSMAVWIMFTSMSLMDTRCPRCAKPLLRSPLLRSWYNNAFSRECLHCGLRIGTAKADTDA